MQSFIPQSYVGLNDGILLTSHEYGKMQLHFDQAHIETLKHQLPGAANQPTHLGVIDGLFQQTGLNYRGTKSMWSINATGSRNIEWVNNGKGIYTWDVPINDCHFNKAKILRWDAQRLDKPGIDESEIYLTLDKRIVGANAAVTFSRFSGVELWSLDSPNGSESEGYTYRFRLAANNNSVTHIPLEYLKESMYVFATIAVTSERNEDYDDRQISAAVRRFYNTMGNAVNQKYFSVTRNAALSQIGSGNMLSHTLEQHTKMFKIDMLDSNSYAARAKALVGADKVSEFLDKGYKNKAELNNAIVHTAIVPQLEMYYMALIESEINYYGIWGNGGQIPIGKDQQMVTLPVGLFRQIMKNANKFSYNLDDFNFDHLLKWLRSGVSKIASPDGRMVITVKTGMGGLELAMQGIAKKFGQVPGTLELNEFVTNKGGQNLQLGFSMGFNRFVFPLGDVEAVFEYAEELDVVAGEPNQIDNPIVNGGYRLSSYCYIVDDITGAGNNILELRNGVLEKDFHIYWVNGKMPYLGDFTRHASVGPSIPGYEVYIEKAFKAYALLDPNKTFMYIPINPQTRTMFGANAYDRW